MASVFEQGPFSSFLSLTCTHLTRKDYHACFSLTLGRFADRSFDLLVISEFMEMEGQ